MLLVGNHGGSSFGKKTKRTVRRWELPAKARANSSTPATPLALSSAPGASSAVSKCAPSTTTSDADVVRERRHMALELGANLFLVWGERWQWPDEGGAGHLDGEEPDDQEQ